MGLTLVTSLFMFLIMENVHPSETPISTILQLRDSVQFSYTTSNKFLDLIRGDKPPSHIIESLSRGRDSRGLSFHVVKPILSAYVGYVVCLVIGLLFVVFMPIVGLIFCCCRCCGNCGGRVLLMDNRKDPCKRVFYTICLVTVVTLQLVATVLVFINHFLLHEAVVNPHPAIGVVSQLNLSFTEIDAALKEILQLAKNTSSANLDDRKQRFDSSVSDGITDFQHQFIVNSRADHVYTTVAVLQSNISLFLPNTPAVKQLADFNNSIQDLVHQLPRLRGELINIIDTECSEHEIKKCIELMNTAKRNLTIRYMVDEFQLPEFSEVIQALNDKLDDVNALRTFEDTLNGISTTITKAFQPQLDDAWTDLANSPETREKLTHVIERSVHTLSDALKRGITSQNDWQSNIYKTRSIQFHLYCGIAILCIPVLIFLLVYFGLCFGTCGDRPYEEAGLCNRGVGANLLMASVGFVFLFSSLLMLICTIAFVTGGLSQTEVCRYLTNRVPDGPLKFDIALYDSASMIKKSVDSSIREIQQSPDTTIHVQTHIDPSVEHLISVSRARLFDALLNRCEREPLVEAMSGGDFVLPTLVTPVEDLLQKLINSFIQIDIARPIEDSVSACLAALRRIRYIGTKFDFSTALKQISEPITNIDDLSHFIGELRKLNRPSLEPIISKLSSSVLSTDKKRSLIRGLFAKLSNQGIQQTSVKESLVDFQNRLPNSINATMQTGLRRLRPLLRKELQLAVIASWSNIPCSALRLGVKRGIDAVCITFLMPLNAFWTGLGLTLLLFIPAIILSVKLAGLYRKTEKYSPDYEEPDYISYHGFYMRPTSDYQAVSQGPHKKTRRKNARSTSNGSKARTVGRSNTENSRAGYHQVSVYPYDTYE